MLRGIDHGLPDMRRERMLPSMMSPERFVELRRTIGWTRRELARLMGCSENVLRQMEASAQGIPPILARWLERLARYHEQNPPPEWRRRTGAAAE
jgi:transcriptional regulator with XRE-family HTH domain